MTAAKFFILAGQASRLPWSSRMMFWETFTSSTREAVACLSALEAAVRKEHDSDVLRALALHPLPGVLPSEAVPWFGNLVKAWEVHHLSIDEWRQQRTDAQLALVRLGSCRLPDGMLRQSKLLEWLQDARSAGKNKCGFRRQEEWAALATWQPQSDEVVDPKNLGRWIAFWQQMHRSSSPITKGIAAKALLNLLSTETGRDSLARSHQPVTVQSLLSGLAAAIDVATEKTTYKFENHLELLNWQPATLESLPAEGLKQVSLALLRATRREHSACRETAWRWLINWDRAGLLTHCGVNLLPHLIAAIQTEQDGGVLWQLAQWGSDESLRRIGRTEVGVVLMKELENEWQAHRQANVGAGRAASWWAGFRLHQAGLATESPESFREAYLSAVAQEKDNEALLALAQCSPGEEAPAAFHREWRQGWLRRLGDKNENIRQVAVLPLLRRALEGVGDGAGLLRVLRDMMHRFPDDPTAEEPVWPDIFAFARDMWEQHWEDETGKVSGTCPAENLSELESRFHKLHFPVLQQTSGNSPLPANINPLTQMG